MSLNWAFLCVYITHSMQPKRLACMCFRRLAQSFSIRKKSISISLRFWGIRHISILGWIFCTIFFVQSKDKARSATHDAVNLNQFTCAYFTEHSDIWPHQTVHCRRVWLLFHKWWTAAICRFGYVLYVFCHSRFYIYRVSLVDNLTHFVVLSLAVLTQI